MIIYKTTNTINGKIYIGKDVKNDPNYIGSGLYIKNAIKKYGKEHFKKETIEDNILITRNKVPGKNLLIVKNGKYKRS